MHCMLLELIAYMASMQMATVYCCTSVDGVYTAPRVPVPAPLIYGCIPILSGFKYQILLSLA